MMKEQKEAGMMNTGERGQFTGGVKDTPPAPPTLDAAEIRFRAERQIGLMMQAQKEAGMMATGTAGLGRPNLGGVENTPPKSDAPTLEDAGIDKNLAKRARAYAAIRAKVAGTNPVATDRAICPAPCHVLHKPRVYGRAIAAVLSTHEGGAECRTRGHIA